MVMVWPALNPIALETRNNGRAHIGGGARGGGAWRANRRDDGGLEVRARINHNRLAGVKIRHAGDFDIGRTGGRTGRQGGGGLRQEIGAVAVGVGAVREAARAPIGSPPAAANRPTPLPEPGAGTRQPLCPDPEAAW